MRSARKASSRASTASRRLHLGADRRREQRKPRHRARVCAASTARASASPAAAAGASARDAEQRPQQRLQRAIRGARPRTGRRVRPDDPHGGPSSARASSRDLPVPAPATRVRAPPKPSAARDPAAHAASSARPRARRRATPPRCPAGGPRRVTTATGIGCDLPLTVSSPPSSASNDRDRALEGGASDEHGTRRCPGGEPRRQVRRVAHDGVRLAVGRADEAREDAARGDAGAQRIPRVGGDDPLHRGEQPALGSSTVVGAPAVRK